MSNSASNTPTTDQPVSSRGSKRRALLIGGPLLMLLVGGYFYLAGGRYVETENAYLKASKVNISAEVKGSVNQVLVRENSRVEQGEVLFSLDPRPYEIARDAAVAALLDTRAEVEGLMHSYQQKQDELALLIEDRDYADSEFRRQQQLVKQHVASQAQLDQAKHQLVSAKQQIVVVRQALATLRAGLGGNPELALEQQPRVLLAQANREQAELDLQHTRVQAPFAGVVSNMPKPGKYIESGQAVMSLVSDTDVWIEANFKETQLDNMRPGQPVDIHIDSYAGKTWQGHVESISQATGAEFSVLPAQNSTGNWVKVVQRVPVRISIEQGQDALPLRAGASTVVEVDTGHSRADQLLGDSVVAAKG
ncbi:HlyD family secretion protein [Oceanobacter mangrovi]|uniref:HlyD family secretion protein n=1 Tax=Oceanobacter mangrovi TaxID=2862510 RepID=UPI001C8DB74D|nr:HlyD family secretion protein [Oceanobacter mangrovi]